MMNILSNTGTQVEARTYEYSIREYVWRGVYGVCDVCVVHAQRVKISMILLMKITRRTSVISNLKFVGKLSERVVSAQLQNHMTHNKCTK